MEDTKIILVRPDNVLVNDFLVLSVLEKENKKIPIKGIVVFVSPSVGTVREGDTIIYEPNNSKRLDDDVVLVYEKFVKLRWRE